MPYHHSVTQFGTTREAKEFLIATVIDTAQRKSVPLSELESRMLYFSQSGWTLPDMAEIEAAFRRRYTLPEYEAKLNTLLRGALHDLRAGDSLELRRWWDAVELLSGEDHYIVHLIDVARTAKEPKPRSRMALYLFALAVLVVMAILAALRASR
jgi:hypothetical protein